MKTSDPKSFVVFLLEEDQLRAGFLRAQLSMILPHATIAVANAGEAEGSFPHADAAVIDGGTPATKTVDVVRALRARGFESPIVVVTPVPEDPALRVTAESLGARAVAREAVDQSPSRLAAALAAAVDAEHGIAAELRQARRVFAAGQAALSLQHAINNPLAALMAEAQLLQLEELTADQRGSVDRMVELCRRIVVLVRQLDALVEG